METESVEEGGEALHEQQHPDGQHGPRHEHDEHSGHPREAVHLQTQAEQHAPQYLRQLCNRKIY